MSAPDRTPAPLEPDLKEAQRFLDMLDPQAEFFTFQCFDDTKGRDRHDLVRVLHGTLAQCAPELARLNAEGAGVFVTVNATDGKGRKAENIVRIRVVFHEDDDILSPAIEFLCQPSIEVMSSFDKYHRYWLVELSREEFAGVMRTMIERFRSDPHCKDVSRVLRVPGFWHRKGKPFMVCIFGASGKRYSPAEILKAFPPIAEEAHTSQPDRKAHVGEPTRDAYAVAGLEAETLKLSETLPGTPRVPGSGRNHALNVAAVKLFGFVASNRLAHAEVEAALLKACDLNLLAKQHGNSAVRATLKSGMKKGLTQPRWDGLPSTAEKDFADVASAGKLLEYPSEISLEAIRLREANALVKGLLYPGETAMLYGASTTGKSFLALDLAWHIALGREWHRHRVKQAAVLYVTLEDEDGFRKRMLAYVKVMGDPGKNFALLVPHVSLVKADRGAEGANCIIKAARELAEASGVPVGLIIIDTFARATAGDDVDGTAEMTSFVENRIGLIARETRALPLVLHHTNAAGTVKNNRALGDACNAVFRTDRNEYRRRLIAEKVKNGAEVTLFDYTLEEVQIDKEDDGSPIVAAVVRTKPVEPSGPGAKREKPKKVPRYMRVFGDAFDAALADGDKIETLSGIDEWPFIQVALSDVREEFFDRYPNDAEDPNVALQTKKRQWRNATDAIDTASYGFERAPVAGVERVWRIPDLSAVDPAFDAKT